MAVTAHVKINDENAESIGRPIFDKILHSFLNSDHKKLIQHFPELQKWMTLELFDEAVQNLNPLGELLSSEYSTYSIENAKHSLAWKVRYKNDENKVFWNLLLDDNQDGIKVNGFRFDR